MPRMKRLSLRWGPRRGKDEAEGCDLRLPPAPMGTGEQVEQRKGASSRFTIWATTEQVVLVASMFWVLAANRRFLQAALHDRPLNDWHTWGFGLALVAMLVALHFVLLALLANRWTLKPLLGVLTVATVFAIHYMQRYGIYLDPSMLRNVLRTDVAEAGELLGWTLVPHLVLYGALPLLLLSRVRVVRRSWRTALGVRAASMAAALAVLVGCGLLVFQPLASLMRTQKEVRYLITPANYLWSLAAVTAQDARGAAGPRQVVGSDAALGPLARQRTRPLVVVLVVGETARAANWGLNGYARQTTPELAALDVVNFREVTACGTSTEVSLPCMFAPVGRRDYDESRIRNSESILHTLARAGVDVLWRDNQSGCKGVCDGLPSETVAALHPAGLCEDGRCLDEGLLVGLDERLRRAHGTQLLVLHQLGNHGPSYFRRYPPAFARFQPACASDDLRHCTSLEIVNAYDNALLYTDHLLASVIAKLRAASSRTDSVLLYVSDHGESLGENNLFLHGIPFAIAPRVQTRVPMVMWLSEGARATLGVDEQCLRQRASQPASHDHLAHTLLGVLDVRTRVYEPAWDLLHGCRRSSVAMAGG